MNKSIGTLITALLILLLAGLAMGAAPEPVCVQANDVVKDAITMEPVVAVVIDGHGTGLMIPEALKGSDFVVPEPVSLNLMAPGDLPSTWDWRDEGGVTPVKNQGGCGACYAFAALGMVEGDILVDGGPAYDFSEEQSKECIWEAINTGAGGCDGGWADWVINLLTREGIVLEADDPYHAYNTSCDSSTTPVERVTEWYMLSGNNVPPTDTLKGYVYNNGPIFTTLDAGCLSGYTSGVISGAGYYDISHAVTIVGWNDSLQYDGGQGAWIVKNSWGDSWGDGGYFYIAYGGAEIGSYSSVMAGYEGYQANVRTENYDESGWKTAWGYVGQDDTWGLCKFIVGNDEDVINIEFWTTGSTSDVDLYLYDSFDGTYLGTELWNVTDLSFNEPGYHSVVVDSAVASDAAVVVAHIHNINSVYSGTQFLPMAVDYNDFIESSKTYISYDGSDGSWLELGDYGYDVALRIRVDQGDSPKIVEIWTEGPEDNNCDAPEGSMPEQGCYCYTAGDTIEIHAVVYDPDGCEDIDTVVADFSEHGISDPVEMELVECHDDFYAEYRGEVQITQSTCHFEDYWSYYSWWCIHYMECDDLPVEVNATDKEGQYDTDETDFCVDPAEPHHLEVTGPDAKFEFPMEWDSKMEQKMCCWDDADWWRKSNGWENCRDFNSTVAYLNVLLFDQYDNIVNDELCYRHLYITNDGTNPLVHAGHCCWDYWEEYGETCHYCCNKLWAVDEIPETVEFTVFYCEEEDHAEVLMLLNDMPEAVACDTHVVTFTNLTDTLNVSVEDVPVYTECDLVANVTAQLVDESGNPLPVAGVPVTFHTSDPNIAEFEDEWTTTDEDGIATAVLNSYSGDAFGLVTVYAAAECRSGNTEFEVLEGPADMTVSCDADYMVTNDSCGDPDGTIVTVQLLNDSGLPFMVAGMNVSVSIYYDYGCPAICPGTYYETDETGTVAVGVNGTSDPCDVTISAYMVNCEIGNSTEIEVVEVVTDALSLVPTEPIFVPFCVGDVQGYEVSGLNTSRDMVMCLECAPEFDVDNDTICSWGTPDGLTNNLTANATGTTTVNVTCGDLTTVNIEVVVEDPDPACTNVVITTEDPVDTVVGDTVTFTASCTDQFGATFTCTELTWSSDNETVGTMGSPTLTALAPGVTNVTATGCGDSNSIQVNVSVAVCTNVVITTEDPVDINIDDTVTFTASCTDQFGDPFTCTELTWNSDNETVGTMSGSTLTALALGVTNVTATGCGDSNSIQVNVSAVSETNGDFDGDGDIDFDDFVEFAGAYGAATCEDSNYDAIADFDDDCDVDFDDFVEFAGVYTG